MKQILKYILGVVENEKNFAENKHSIALAVAAAIVVFCATKLNDAFNLSAIFSTIAIGLCSISMLLCFLAMSARRVKTKKYKVKKNNFEGSLMFYSNIASFDAQSYLERIVKNYGLQSSYKPDGFDVDLANHIIAESKVAKLKYSYFNLAIFFLIFGVSFVIVSFLAVAFLGA